MTIRECYTILGLAKDATLDDVKSAYRKLAFELHPDLNPEAQDAQARFQQLNEAYVLLKDAMEQEPAASSQKQTEKKKSKEAASSAQKQQARPKQQAEPEQRATQKQHAQDRTVRKESRKATRTAATQKKKKRKKGLYFKEEEVMGNILNDPFAREVFNDIYARLKKEGYDTPKSSAKVIRRNLSLRLGDKRLSMNLTGGLTRSATRWLKKQLDDEQKAFLPAGQLLPGRTVRLTIHRAWTDKTVTVDIPLPANFILGRPLRLKGLGRKLGPFNGDLYLRLLAK